MFKKVLTRSENSQGKMSDSALRGIIPSDDAVPTKRSSRKHCLSICKILISILMLGLIAVGIVLLALILTYSGKSFMSFILQTSGMKLFSLSNRTTQQENSTRIIKEPEWKKITVIPLTSKQQMRTLSTIMRTKQENKQISTNTQSTKSYPTSNRVVIEQSADTTVQTTISNRQSTTTKNHEHIQTSLEIRMTTTDDFISTFLTRTSRDHQTTLSPKFLSTAYFPFKPSTDKTTTTKHQQIKEDNLLDDLLFS